MFDVVGSIVAFKNKKDTLQKAVNSFLSADLNCFLYVIDNSPTDELRDVCCAKNAEYIFNGKNVGFGAGHNIALRRTIGMTKYSLILNPDVFFDKGTITRLFDFMEGHAGVGSVMPKVLYHDGSMQYLCRLLPNPLDLVLRKTNNAKPSWISERLTKYELKFADHTKSFDVPYLSGCFMFIRTEILQTVGVFDERFFLYFEDVDLSRRIHKRFRTVYYPQASIYHGYQRGSDKDMGHFAYLVGSGIKYFNKWGWFFDQDRRAMNKKALRSLDLAL